LTIVIDQHAIQTEQRKSIHRFPPKSLYRVTLIEWFVIRPTEIIIASVLGLDSAVQELRFRLYPGVYRTFTSNDLSDCLKRDTQLYTGQRIGIADFRDIQSTFINQHVDPNALPMSVPDSAGDLQQGHSGSTAQVHYGKDRNLNMVQVKGYRRASAWWQHITGKWDARFGQAHAHLNIFIQG
jgi:hypothetical protein